MTELMKIFEKRLSRVEKKMVDLEVKYDDLIEANLTVVPLKDKLPDKEILSGLPAIQKLLKQNEIHNAKSSPLKTGRKIVYSKSSLEKIRDNDNDANFNIDDYYLKNFSHLKSVVKPNDDDDGMLKPKQSLSSPRGGGSSEFSKTAANYIGSHRRRSESEPGTINSHFQNLLVNATRRYEPTDKPGDVYRTRTNRHEKNHQDNSNRNLRAHKDPARKLTTPRSRSRTVTLDADVAVTDKASTAAGLDLQDTFDPLDAIIGLGISKRKTSHALATTTATSNSGADSTGVDSPPVPTKVEVRYGLMVQFPPEEDQTGTASGGGDKKGTSDTITTGATTATDATATTITIANDLVDKRNAKHYELI